MEHCEKCLKTDYYLGVPGYFCVKKECECHTPYKRTTGDYSDF